MPHNFARISALGFSRAGCWFLNGERLELEIDPLIRTAKNVLYAFVVDGALAYVGKTSIAVRDRLQRYKTPAKDAQRGGSTNIKNHGNIRTCLSAGQTVEIYILTPQREESYGGFKISVAAALEDSLIAELKPAWNGGFRRSSATLHLVPNTVPSATGAKGKNNLHIIGVPAGLFRSALLQVFADAVESEAKHVDVQAGALHRRVGGYPQKGHSMPTCCSVMRQAMRSGDELLSEPPKGKGATLSIRYRIPR